MAEDQRRLITTGELAKVFGVHPRTIQRYRRLGWITPAWVSLGGHARWVLEDVQEQVRIIRQEQREELERVEREEQERAQRDNGE